MTMPSQLPWIENPGSDAADAAATCVPGGKSGYGGGGGPPGGSGGTDGEVGTCGGEGGADGAAVCEQSWQQSAAVIAWPWYSLPG